jgi:hypothetical protein
MAAEDIQQTAEYAERFRSIIDQATERDLLLRAHDTDYRFPKPGLLASENMSVGAGERDQLSFFHYDIQAGNAAEQAGFDFSPSHMMALSARGKYEFPYLVVAKFSPYGAQVMRVLAIQEHDRGSSPVGQRQLNDEEAKALIDYATSPHLALVAREVILGTTPEENEAMIAALAIRRQVVAEREQAIRDRQARFNGKIGGGL